MLMDTRTASWLDGLLMVSLLFSAYNDVARQVLKPSKENSHLNKSWGEIVHS